MIDYGKLYDEFLYDCHVANQRLTEEDWYYYGKEEHHIEVPKRDGGLLTPLNSQYLTTHQHWVAGVLQSETLEKLCFAMVPKDYLPEFLENLRKKWATAHNLELNTLITTEQRRARRAKQVERSTTEQRSAIAKKRQQNKTPEQRRAEAVLAHSRRSPERRVELAKQRRAKQLEKSTPEQRSEITRKAWETRRRKAQGG